MLSLVKSTVGFVSGYRLFWSVWFFEFVFEDLFQNHRLILRPFLSRFSWLILVTL